MDLKKITYFLITGASRGIGQTMAIECSKKFKPGSVVVLLARTESGLVATKNQILAENSTISVKTFVLDLTKASKAEMQQAITSSLEGHQIEDFERAFVVHNAGSPGDSTKSAKELDNLATWTDYYKLNVFSVTILNSIFMEIFQTVEKLVVNITSLCGIEPFKSLTLYCSGKAAREMYFKVLAAEEENTVVLNYSPGPVDTEMVQDIKRNSKDEGLRSFFTEKIDQKTILTTAQTTAKFIEVLEGFKFKSGDHVDYFD